MAEELVPQTEELRTKWDRGGVLYHFWTALQLDNAADHLKAMAHHETGLDAEKTQKRQTMLTLLAKFCESGIDEELKIGYAELGQYLTQRGLLGSQT